MSEWHNWQPSRIDASHEADDWSDFLAWCDVWGKWLDRTVVTLPKGAPEPAAPAWYATVYGGRR